MIYSAIRKWEITVRLIDGTEEVVAVDGDLDYEQAVATAEAVVDSEAEDFADWCDQEPSIEPVELRAEDRIPF